MPQAGEVAKPSSPALTASTASEQNESAKTGMAATPGVNATIAPLGRVRADGGGQALTTNQGVPIADDYRRRDGRR